MIYWGAFGSYVRGIMNKAICILLLSIVSGAAMASPQDISCIAKDGKSSIEVVIFQDLSKEGLIVESGGLVIKDGVEIAKFSQEQVKTLVQSERTTDIEILLSNETGFASLTYNAQGTKVAITVSLPNVNLVQAAATCN